MDKIIKIVLIIMLVSVAMAIAVVGTANASVGALQRSSVGIQSIIGKINKAETFSEFSRNLETITSSVRRMRSQFNKRISASVAANDMDAFQRANVEYQQEAVKIKSELIRALEGSEFQLDNDVLSVLDDVDMLLLRVHVIH